MSETTPSSPEGTAPAVEVPVAAPVAAEALYPADKPAEAAAPVEAAKPVESAPEPSLAAAPAPEIPLTLEDYKLELPENMKIDETLLGEFKNLALEGKMPPAEAQKMASLYAKALEGQMAAFQTQQQETRAAWLTEINSDPLFQGERRTQSLAVLGTAMKEYGSPEAAAILNESGLGNHPAIVRYIYNLANGLVEGGPMPADRPAPNGKSPRTAGEILYPSMKTS